MTSGRRAGASDAVTSTMGELSRPADAWGLVPCDVRPAETVTRGGFRPLSSVARYIFSLSSHPLVEISGLSRVQQPVEHVIKWRRICGYSTWGVRPGEGLAAQQVGARL